ncbi:MAG: hypothetical protein WAO71_03570 [Gallionella sp.]
MELVAKGTAFNDLLNMRNFDQLIPEGSRGILELNTIKPAPKWIISTLDSAVRKYPNAYVKAVGNKIQIHFKKEFPWLPIIVGVIIPLLIVLAIVIVAWKLYKQSPMVASMALILGIGLAGLATIGLIRRTYGS